MIDVARLNLHPSMPAPRGRMPSRAP
jgi:hypothetical protein